MAVIQTLTAAILDNYIDFTTLPPPKIFTTPEKTFFRLGRLVGLNRHRFHWFNRVPDERLHNGNFRRSW